MISDLLSEVAGLVYIILEGVDARGPRAELQGPSLYEFINDLLRAYPRSGVQRVDDHTLGLRDAALVFEVIDEAEEHVAGPSLEQLEERGIHVAVSHLPGDAPISFQGTSDAGRRLEGRILPARGWGFLIASSSEDAAAELARMVDEHLASLDRADG